MSEGLIPRSESLDSLVPARETLPAEWKLSEAGMTAVQIAHAMASTKHGLYASIPMLCKAEGCPYAEVCPLVEMGRAPKAERCPIEIARILKKYDDYTDELQIDPVNGSIIDLTLVKDLIDLDIQITRADNKLAIDGDFIQEQVVGISEATGEAITTPAIHKAIDYKERLLKKRHDVLQLLHSTRKDKAGDKLTISMDPSSYAAKLMEQANKMRNRKVINPEEDDA